MLMWRHVCVYHYKGDIFSVHNRLPAENNSNVAKNGCSLCPGRFDDSHKLLLHLGLVHGLLEDAGCPYYKKGDHRMDGTLKAKKNLGRNT